MEIMLEYNGDVFLNPNTDSNIYVLKSNVHMDTG